MTDTYGLAFGMAELRQGGAQGQAESHVQLASPEGTVGVDVSASFTDPNQPAQSGYCFGAGWSKFKA